MKNDRSQFAYSVSTTDVEVVSLPLCTLGPNSNVVLNIAILGRASNQTYDAEIRITAERLGTGAGRVVISNPSWHTGAHQLTTAMSNNQVLLMVRGIHNLPIQWAITGDKTLNIA